MAGNDLQTKLRKRLETLLKQPDNQVCADCRKRGPRWASANLGTFFCIECSGIHRNLGVHISFVRSINLDSWTPEQVAFMEQWGNGRANAYYEANLPPQIVRPKDGDSVRTIEKFIRDKYEHKRYIADTVPPQRSSEVESTESKSTQQPSRRAQRLTTQSAEQNTRSTGIDHRGLSNLTARNQSEFSSPAQMPPMAPAVVEAPSLIDFSDDSCNQTQAAIIDTSSAFPQSAVDTFGAASLNDFSAQQQQQQPYQQINDFAPSVPYGTSPSMHNSTEQSKQKASADAILSLYNGNTNSLTSGMMSTPNANNYYPQIPYQQQYSQQYLAPYPSQQQAMFGAQSAYPPQPPQMYQQNYGSQYQQYGHGAQVGAYDNQNYSTGYPQLHQQQQQQYSQSGTPGGVGTYYTGAPAGWPTNP